MPSKASELGGALEQTLSIIQTNPKIRPLELRDFLSTDEINSIRTGGYQADLKKPTELSRVSPPPAKLEHKQDVLDFQKAGPPMHSACLSVAVIRTV